MEQLLSTTDGIEALAGVGTGRASVHPALGDARALFGVDLAYVDDVLGSVAREGEAPGTHAAAHLVASGGKRIRAMTVLLSASCFGGVGPAARELAIVAEMIHAATLLHDDVIDDSDERRGRPTSRRIYGNAVSVLAGDLLLTHALDRTSRAAPDALGELLVTLRKLVDGEVIQLRGRTEIDLRVATCERIVAGKTASLFAWATRAGARSAGAPAVTLDPLGAFGERVGVAFQLVDDVLDYEGDPRATGKALLGDLHEGKVTMPLAIAAAKDDGIVADVNRVRAGDDLAADRVALAVRRSGACEEVRRRAKAATDDARAALRALPASPARDLLDRVAADLVSRGALGEGTGRREGGKGRGAADRAGNDVVSRAPRAWWPRPTCRPRSAERSSFPPSRLPVISRAPPDGRRDPHA